MDIEHSALAEPVGSRMADVAKSALAGIGNIMVNSCSMQAPRDPHVLVLVKIDSRRPGAQQRFEWIWSPTAFLLGITQYVASGVSALPNSAYKPGSFRRTTG